MIDIIAVTAVDERKTRPIRITPVVGIAKRSLLFTIQTKVTYAGLVEYLLKHVDPTDRTGSFIDKGLHYTTAIYYATPEEKSEAQRVVRAIEEMKVLRGSRECSYPASAAFWPAEEYHQNYHSNNADKYANYRATCGRDVFVQKLWGTRRKSVDYPRCNPTSRKSRKRNSRSPIAGKPKTASEAEGQETEKDLAAWMKFKKPSDRELRKKLTSIQFEVTQKNATEIAFRNPFWNNHDEGLYRRCRFGLNRFSHRWTSLIRGPAGPHSSKQLILA